MEHRKFYEAGLATIPIGENKEPLVKWQEYITRPPRHAIIGKFETMSERIALINGNVSGKVITFDFDSNKAFKDFVELCKDFKATDIARKCALVKSPHGYHLRFRSTKPPKGNKVLARDMSKEVLVETRGEGGYCLIPPTAGYEYQTNVTDFELPILTIEEEELLFTLATSMDCTPKAGKVEPEEREHIESGRAGDVYNQTGHDHFVTALQEDAGWSIVKEEGEKSYWRRAGKDEGISATFNHEDSGLFHVFSSSVIGLNPGAYKMFTAYATILHAGNYAEAAIVLANAGYGTAIDGEFKEFNSLETHEVPEFPVDIFPKWASDYLTDISASTQTPVDLGAMLLLSLGASCIARKMFVLPKEDWKEPTCLYTASFANPAARKSPVFDRIIKPFLEHQNKANASSIIDRQVQASRKKALFNKIKGLEEKMGEATDDEFVICEELLRNSYEQIEKIGNTEPAVYACDDVTIEKLADLLENNGSRMAMFSDEAGVFEQIGGKYGAKNLDVYLKGYSAGTVTVHRIGRPANIISNTHITIGLSVQPIVLENLGKNTDLEQRGVLGRFLYSYPLSNVGTRLGRGANVNREFQSKYEEHIQMLADTDYKRIPATSETNEIVMSYSLRFTQDADAMFWAFQEEVEKSMGEGGEMEYLSSWTGKIMGNLARISAILHCMEQVGKPTFCEFIGLETICKALSLYPYLKEHAKKIYYFLSSDKDLRLAVKITKYLVSESIAEISRRDLHHHFQTACPRSSDLDEPLTMLEQRGYIRRQSVGKQQGRPREMYETNPIMLQHYTENTARYLG